MAASLLQTIVEHVVLFKAKAGASQESLKACMSRFRALGELEGVAYLHAGAIRTCQPEEGAWTHVLYGRYKDKAALHTYAKHPAHVHAVALADPLFQDKMALDWQAPVPVECTHIQKPSAHILKSYFTAAHIVFVQWMHHPHAPELETALSQSLVSSLPASSSSSSWTCGPNFSPARARNFHWGFAALLDTRSTPRKDVLVKILSHDLSVRSFLCVYFVTDDEFLARM